MAMTRYLTVSVVLLAILLAGCGTKQDAGDLGKPTARMVRVRFDVFDPKTSTLLFDIEVDNPLKVGLPLAGLHYTFTNGPSASVSGSADANAIIPAGTQRIVSLSAQVNYRDFVGALKGTPGTALEYKGEFWLAVDAPQTGLTKLAFQSEGRLTLPEELSESDEPDTTILSKDRLPDVVFVPTPHEVVAKMLELAQVTKDDVLYDLGCGDGRIPVTAAKKYGCRAFGFDIDPERIKESLENVAQNDVAELVTIEEKDIFTLDLSGANVITLYLLPSLNVKLIPQLEKLKPGSRIVSHDFDMEGVQPDKIVRLTSEDGGVEHTVYLWTAPLKKIRPGVQLPPPVELVETIGQ